MQQLLRIGSGIVGILNKKIFLGLEIVTAFMVGKTGRTFKEMY